MFYISWFMKLIESTLYIYFGFRIFHLAIPADVSSAFHPNIFFPYITKIKIEDFAIQRWCTKECGTDKSFSEKLLIFTEQI